MNNEEKKKLIAFKIGNPKKLYDKNGTWKNPNFPEPTEQNYIDWAVEYADMKAAKAVISKLKAWKRKRRIAYKKAGLTFEYWIEINIEQDQEKIDQFSADREQIRIDIPKED